MKHDTPSVSRRIAAFLLPTLPGAVALAAYAHGHGSLDGRSLGMVVLMAILAGAVSAIKLLSPPPAEAGEPAHASIAFRGYRR